MADPFWLDQQLFAHHIGAGRIRQRRVGALPCAHRRRRDARTRVLHQPRLLRHPPRTLLYQRFGPPVVGIEIAVVRRAGGHLEAAPGMALFAHHAGVVPTAGEHEAHLGIAEQVDLVHRPRRRHVIAHCIQRQDGQADIGECNDPVIGAVAALGQVVVETEAAEVFAVHAMRHVRCVSVPYEAKLAGLLVEARAPGLVRTDLEEEAAALQIAIIQRLVTCVLMLGPRKPLPDEAKRLFPIFLAGISARESRTAERQPGKRSPR